MALNPIVARAYRETYSVTELEELRAACLTVHANGGVVSRSFEGSSLTMDAGNCVAVLENVMEALRLHDAEAEGWDGELSRPSMGIALDFRHKRLT